MTHPLQSAIGARLMVCAEERDLAITVADVLALAAAAFATPMPGAPITLTDQQTAVLIALTVGEPTEAVARRMCITTSTVKTHRRVAYRRLGVRTGAQAVATAMTLGLLPGLPPMPDEPDRRTA